MDIGTKNYIKNLPQRTKLVYEMCGEPERFTEWLEVWVAAGFPSNIVIEQDVTMLDSEPV